MIQLKDKTFEVFLSQQEILNRIETVANQINEDYKQKFPLFIAILNGAFMFASDLVKNITLPCNITFVKVASYQAMQSSGTVKSLIGLPENIANRDVIILEDIVDTGITMDQILNDLLQKKPASVEVATLLLKPEALQKKVELKYVGFEIPDKFVVGYGLDYDGLGRNLPDLYVLKEEVYSL